MPPQVNYVSFCKQHEGEKKENRINNTVDIQKMLLKHNFVHECLPLAAGSKDTGDAQAR